MSPPPPSLRACVRQACAVFSPRLFLVTAVAVAAHGLLKTVCPGQLKAVSESASPPASQAPPPPAVLDPVSGQCNTLNKPPEKVGKPVLWRKNKGQLKMANLRENVW